MSEITRVITLEWESDLDIGVKSKMYLKNYLDKVKWTYFCIIMNKEVRKNMEWKVRSFINGRPIEEYSREEIDAFFKVAWERAFRAIGYEFRINEEKLEEYKKEAAKHGVIIKD